MFEISESGLRADDKSRINISFEAGFSSAKGLFSVSKTVIKKDIDAFLRESVLYHFSLYFQPFCGSGIFNIP